MSGSGVRVEADRELCVGSGQCVMMAPDVFDQDDDASVVVLEDHPSSDLMTDVDAAVSGCPAAAIVLRKEG